jgi:endonuclease/exonuclease/phosphatase family metal-dependent hydrolase
MLREAGAMRLLTWNLHCGHGDQAQVHAQAAAIRATDADVAVLQEVVGGAGHAGVLAAGWPYHAFARARGRFGGGAQGNLLLSRHPIATWTGHDLSNHPWERRVALHAEIGGLHVVVVHLDLSGLGRRLQLAKLVGLMPDNVPLVLAGDCNDWSHELDHLLVAHGLHEAHRLIHGRVARTWPARAALLSLDRIYVRGLAVVDALRLDAERLSDHHGVLALLRTARPGSGLAD